MSLDTLVVLANQYDSESDAIADYEAVRKLYTDTGIIDTTTQQCSPVGRMGRSRL
jgi:hypothetical protein